MTVVGVATKKQVSHKGWVIIEGESTITVVDGTGENVDIMFAGINFCVTIEAAFSMMGLAMVLRARDSATHAAPV